MPKPANGKDSTPQVVSLGDLRNPLSISVDDDGIVTIRFDSTYTAPERTEKGNARVASTLGNKEITPGLFLGLNAYRKL